MKTSVMLMCCLQLAVAHAACGQGKWDEPPPESTPLPEPHAGDSVDALYLKANNAFAAKDYELAIKCWTEVLKINPDDGTACVNRAGVYVKTGDVEKALADYAKAIRIDPKDASAYEYRAELYEDRRASAFAKGAVDDPTDTEKAIADYTEATQLAMSEQDHPGKWAQDKAVDADQTQNYMLAVACWSAVLKLDPKNAAAWFRLAVAHAQVLETDNALADCDKALGIDPENDDAREFRSQIEEQAKAPVDKDVADLTQKIHAKPGTATYNARAQWWLDMGEGEKAVADFHEILWLNSNDTSYGRSAALRCLVSIYGGEGKWEKAMEICNLAAATGGGDDHSRRAWIYVGMGDYARASIESHKDVEDAKKLAKLVRDQDIESRADAADEAAEEAQADAAMVADVGGRPPPKPAPPRQPTAEEEEDYNLDTCKALIRCGEIDYRAKMYDKALADLTEEQKLDPKDPWGKNAMAWFLATCPDAKFRNGAEAIKLAKAGGVIDTLAAAYAEAGKWDEAIAEEKKAIEEDKEEMKKTSAIAAQAAKALDGLTDPAAIRKQKRQIWQTTNAIKADEEEIKEYEDRLLLYQQKKPCREAKDMDVGG